MIRFTSSLALLLVFTLITGCDEPASVQNTPEGTNTTKSHWQAALFSSVNPADGYIVATVERGVGTFPTGVFSVTGSIYDTASSNYEVDGGTMTAAGYQLTSTAAKYFVNGSTSASTKPVFGDTTTWGISGNSTKGIPSYSLQLYVPAEIKMTTPASAGTNVSRTSGLLIGWNSDSRNDSVAIIWTYDGANSHYHDSTMSFTDAMWYKMVPDNGSYTLTSTDLSGLPAGSYMKIKIARGAANVAFVNGRAYQNYGYSFAGGTFKVTS